MPHAADRFYKMALNWTDDPKVADLGRFGKEERALARDLFNQMIRYSRANLTDGVGPGEMLASLSGLDEDRAYQLAGYLADPGTLGAADHGQYRRGGPDRQVAGARLREVERHARRGHGAHRARAGGGCLPVERGEP